MHASALHLPSRDDSSHRAAVGLTLLVVMPVTSGAIVALDSTILLACLSARLLIGLRQL